MLLWIRQMSGAYKDEQAEMDRAQQQDMVIRVNEKAVEPVLEYAESDSTRQVHDDVLARMAAVGVENGQTRRHIKAISERLNIRDDLAQDAVQNTPTIGNRPKR